MKQDQDLRQKLNLCTQSGGNDSNMFPLRSSTEKKRLGLEALKKQQET